MTRGQLSKYIEELKIEAVQKVRNDCKIAKESRKQEIVDQSNMAEELRKIKADLENSIHALKQLKVLAGCKVDADYGGGPINQIGYRVESLNVDSFLWQEDVLEKDPRTIAIATLEKQSVNAVVENYDTLRENCKIYKNTVEAVEYLQTLGFTVPDFEAPKKLMKPLDTRFLIMKGTNKEEEEQN